MKNDLDLNLNPVRTLHPLLIGSGKLSRHLKHYFDLLKVESDHWTKPRELNDPTLAPLIRSASHIFLLVSDQALSMVYETVQTLLTNQKANGLILHSSAATSIPGAITLHPLMTFGPELYSLEVYQSIPLTLFKEETSDFESELLPLFQILKNPVQTLDTADRARYHVSCVMMANYPQILWEAALSVSKNAHLPRSSFAPILKQSLQNYLKLGEQALTGPLLRNDQNTLTKHLETLAGTPEADLYRAFVDYYDRKKGDRKS
jgi:hypothetical protein